MPTPKIAFLILAAGASSRMGSPKQLLEWKGSTLLGQVIDTAMALMGGTVYVVLGAHSEAIKSAHLEKKVKWQINKDWELGLGSSLALGVQKILESEAEVSGILILLADQPFIDAEYLGKIIDVFHKNRKKIVATGYKEGIGVPALFGPEYYEELMRLNSDKGAKQLLRAHQSEVEIVVASGKEMDIDTQEDYKVWKERQN